jgi:predicted nucleic acid-binding protein
VIAYVDSSVIARIVLRQADRLVGLEGADRRLTSLVTQLECLRALDRARIEEHLDPDEISARRTVLYGQLRRMERVAVSRSVLERAGEPMPGPVKTLDAIHIATALRCRERGVYDLAFATHDRQQGRVAADFGFEVIGV